MDDTVKPKTTDGQTAVSNDASGVVAGSVVQAGSITGNVHFHNSQPKQLIPQQLPSAPAKFVGRADELARLTEALDKLTDADSAVQVSALAGAGGTGKTWLALHWAHQHLDQFPDGQLFVDLQGFSPTDAPMDPTVAVRGFLDALGVVPNRIPPDLHAQTTLFRSLVGSKRMLIVLDNAADATQVTPLLPGSPTCAVVVTSRRHLTSLVTRHGARHLRIGPLSGTEAHQLLAARLGADRVEAEPDAVAELLACCSGFPLALGIVAGRAHMAPETPLAELAVELRDATTRLGVLTDEDPTVNLPAVLSWSLPALGAEQARMFGLLGIAPGPAISLMAAASLTALPTTRTSAVLRGLEQVSLLDRDANSRYRMHDLVRLHARDNHPEADLEVALRRVVDFYLHTAYAGDRYLNRHATPLDLEPPLAGCQPQPLDDAAASMAWFVAEHPCLLGAQRAAAVRGWHQVVWQLAVVLQQFHYRRGHRHDAVAVLRTGLAAAEHLTDATASIDAHRLLGAALGRVGQESEGLEHLRRALTLAEHAQSRAHQAHTHQALASALGRRGEHRRALEHASRALHLYEKDPASPVWKASALNLMGWHAAQTGDYERARAHCQAALDLHRDHLNHDGEATALYSLGYVDHHNGDHNQALAHYQQALVLRRALGNTYQVANTLDRLGHEHVACEQVEQARVVWREALELFQAQGRDDAAVRVQRQIDDLGA